MLGILIVGIEVVAIFAAVLMVFLILLQEPKSGGLAMLGGTGLDRSLGVSNPLRKATVYMAIFFMAGSLLLAVYQSSARRTTLKVIDDDQPVKHAAAKPAVTTPKPAVTAEPLYVVKVTKKPAEMKQLSETVTKITNEKDPTKVLQKIDSVITVAPKIKAEEYKKELEAAGATVEISPETTPLAPPTSNVPEARYLVSIADPGKDMAALKAAVSDLTGEKDDAKLTAKIAAKVILVETLAKATDAQLKLEKAGAKVNLDKIENAPATTPPAPAASTGAAPSGASTTPAAPAPAPAEPAPAAPAPAPAHP